MRRVVASVGTDHHPFDRLLEWLAAAAEQLDVRVTAQCGATPTVAGIEGFDYLPAVDLIQLMRDADAVVCHGGPGTIAMARDAGHIPIVVPRDPARAEHVDDHQLRYCDRLQADGVIDVAGSFEELIGLLEPARPRVAVSDAGEQSTAVSEFGDLVDRLIEGTLPRRRVRDRVRLRRQAKTQVSG